MPAMSKAWRQALARTVAQIHLEGTIRGRWTIRGRYPLFSEFANYDGATISYIPKLYTATHP